MIAHRNHYAPGEIVFHQMGVKPSPPGGGAQICDVRLETLASVSTSWHG
jgi:hypothetical protein